MSRTPVPVFGGAVDADGKLHLDEQERERRRTWLRSLRNQPVQVVIKKATRAKSQSQLGYLWGVLYPVIAEEIGYSEYEAEELHDACMRRLRGLKPGPNPLELRETLRDKDHEYVSNYISDLRHWALTQYGIETPDSTKAEAAA
jgi:hypothetical protein